MENYLDGKREKSIEILIKIHTLINRSLRFQFKERGLTKKIKISNK